MHVILLLLRYYNIVRQESGNIVCESRQEVLYSAKEPSVVRKDIAVEAPQRSESINIWSKNFKREASISKSELLKEAGR